MEEPLEIPIMNDLTMVLGSISQVIYSTDLSLSLDLSLFWVNKLTLYCILVVKSNRSCH
jgi:hypothetical protein